MADALVRSTVHRRVTRMSNGCAGGERSEPDGGRGAKRARGCCGCRLTSIDIVRRQSKRKRIGPRHREVTRPVIGSGGHPLHRDAELPRLVDEVLGDAAAGERDDALRQQVQEVVVAPERSGPSVARPVGLADD